MSNDQMSGPACAHKTVINRNNERHGVVTSEWWECKECGTRFAPIQTFGGGILGGGGQVQVTDQQAAELASGYKSMRDEMKRNHEAHGYQAGKAAPPDPVKYAVKGMPPIPSNPEVFGLQWWHSEVSKKLMESAVEKKRLESEVDTIQHTLISVRADNNHLVERVAYHQGKIKTAEGKLEACEQELKIVRANLAKSHLLDECGFISKEASISLRQEMKDRNVENEHLRHELKLVRADRDRFIEMGGMAKSFDALHKEIADFKSDAHKDQLKINQLNEVNKELRAQLQTQDTVHAHDLQIAKDMRVSLIKSHRSNIDEKMGWIKERDAEILYMRNKNAQAIKDYNAVVNQVKERDEKIKWLTEVPRLMLEWITAKITTYELDIAGLDKKLSTTTYSNYGRYPVEVEKWCKHEHIRMLNEFKSSIEDSLKRNGQ